jgi:hypothetical protein
LRSASNKRNLLYFTHMMKSRKVPLWLEAVGWYGPVAYIAAFGLASFEVIEVRGYIFQLLSLTGAISIIAISVRKQVYQSVVLNAFFVGISVITLIQLI